MKQVERFAVLGLALAAIAAGSCGGDARPSGAAPAAESSGAERPAAARAPGMQVEGILGTIPQGRIEEAMRAQLPAFQRCFFDGSADVEMLGGHFKFYFRVGLDGRVEWVHPRGSSVGHRMTESCLLARAARMRFSEPKGGGPAEFAWGFEIEPTDGVRAAVPWPADKVEPVLAAHRAELSACVPAGAHYNVTLYVASGGSVLAAGAAADSQPAADKIDCIIAAVKSWQLPDPGSYPAKVSFDL